MECCNTADDAALSIETLGQDMEWPPSIGVFIMNKGALLSTEGWALIYLLKLVEFLHDVRYNLLLVFSNISINFAKNLIPQLIDISIFNRNIQDSDPHPTTIDI